MFSIVKTTSENSEFQMLSNEFDDFLVEIDGDEREFFKQYNSVYLKNVIILYENKIPVGCGAFKEIEPKVAEIKRMYVRPEFRNKGYGIEILKIIEDWAIEEKHDAFILETSPKLKSAIRIYEKFGYKIIPNYGQYIGIENSVCMKKEVR